MGISFTVLCASYMLIVRRDQSWINWATPAFFFMIGGRYVLQFVHLCLGGPDGSHYAYFFCYTTYALSFLIGALVYAFVRPIQLKASPGEVQNVGQWPWLLLAVSFLLYLPILIEFRSYLDDPRRIYELTRTGYGVWFYGSTTFGNLAFIAYLFKRNTNPISTLCFYATIGVITYWHGSKGLILAYALIWVLHRVYVSQKKISAMLAISLFLVASTIVLSTFALFQSSANTAELVTSVVGYADYVRNAMMIIDDEHSRFYYGRLTLETEVYSRLPRVLMSDKPKDFGALMLAKMYYPGSYRANAGVPAFDIGVQYADFGPLSIIFLCLSSGVTAWFVSTATFRLRQSSSLGTFIVLLYLAGVSVVVAGAASYLPEVMLIAGALSLLLRISLVSGNIALDHSKHLGHRLK